MSKNKKFIMIGERGPKGKIVKCEQLPFDEIAIKAIKMYGSIRCKPPRTDYTIFERLFKWKKLRKEISHERFVAGLKVGFNDGLRYLKAAIVKLIDADEFGNKRKKKKKKNKKKG